MNTSKPGPKPKGGAERGPTWKDWTDDDLLFWIERLCARLSEAMIEARRRNIPLYPPHSSTNTPKQK